MEELLQRIAELEQHEKEQDNIIAKQAKEIEAVKSANAEKEEMNNRVIAKLEKEVKALTEKSELLQKQQSDIVKQMQIWTFHVNQLYNATDIKHSLRSMADLSKAEFGVEQCEVYILDPNKSQMYTIDDYGDKHYIPIIEGSAMELAARYGQSTIVNDFTNENIGDNKSLNGIRNFAVVPIESDKGELYGIAVAKNKPVDFTKDDVEAYNLDNGTIGSAFRMGFESKMLKQQAFTDRLTGLHNRAGLEDYMKHEVLADIQDDKAISTIIIDIDDFKKFNDIYGHNTGDEVLRLVADTLRSNIRPTDEVARWGGEEIVIISKSDEKDTYALAERLRKAIAETQIEVDEDKFINISISLGVAQLDPREYLTATQDNILNRFENRTLKVADERLYMAKHAGKNMVIASQDIMPLRQEDYIVDNYQHIDDIQLINTPMLCEDGDILAEMVVKGADNDLTSTVTLQIEGTAEIYYQDELYKKPSEYTPELREALENDQTSSMQIIKENKIVASILVENEAGDVLVDKKLDFDQSLDRLRLNEIREAIFAEGADAIIEAVELEAKLEKSSPDVAKEPETKEDKSQTEEKSEKTSKPFGKKVEHGDD
jgi:diguanylate cyclase (GGDEF)-like protein